MITRLLICLIAFSSWASAQNASTQQNTPTQDASAQPKAAVTAEDLAGKTFVYIDGAWGQRGFFFRKDGTFKVCGGPRTGCDEGSWTVAEGKVQRVHNTWFATRNNRPNGIVVTVEGKKGSFAGLSARVLDENEPMPGAPVYDDPRK